MTPKGGDPLIRVALTLALFLILAPVLSAHPHGQSPPVASSREAQPAGYWATVTTMQPVQRRVWMQPTVRTRWEWRPLEALLHRSWQQRRETVWTPSLPGAIPQQ